MVTIAAVVAYYRTPTLHEWMPHVAAAAATIGLTVTFVDAIITRAARERLRPWFDRAVNDLIDLSIHFAWDAATEYGSTHLRTFESPPKELPRFFEFWLREQERVDIKYTSESGASRIVESGQTFARSLDVVRSQDTAVLTPRLIRGIDDFVAAAQMATVGLMDRQSSDALVVHSALRFVSELAHESGRKSISDDGIASRGWAAHSRLEQRIDRPLHDAEAPF
jgi:hypothetical protein